MQKHVRIAVAILVLLLSSGFVNAQADTTIYKLKIDHYESLQRTGKTLTITGVAVGAVGVGLTIIGIVEPDFWSDETIPLGVGIPTTVLGVGTVVTGLIMKKVGKQKAREYKILLDDLSAGFHITPQCSGITLTYRF